jgi:hypothetical protein
MGNICCRSAQNIRTIGKHNTLGISTYIRKETISETVIFRGSIPFDINGLVRIIKDKDIQCKVNIIPSATKLIEITMQLPKYDQYGKGNYVWKEKSYGDKPSYFPHLPWWSNGDNNICEWTFKDNTKENTEHKENEIVHTRYEKYRGDNRMDLSLRQSGTYNISVPDLTMIESNLNSDELYIDPHQSKPTLKLALDNISKLSKNIFSENINNNLVEYIGGFQLEKNSFVRIRQDTNDKIKLIIKSHESSDIKMCYIGDDQLFDKFTPFMDRLPFTTDGLYDEEHPIVCDKDNKSIRILNGIYYNNNRIIIGLKEPGTYTLFVPNDCDLETKLISGDIDFHYDVKRATRLHVDCTSVNKWGDNGMSNGDEQRWDYYQCGSQPDPITKLETNGHINIIGIY